MNSNTFKNATEAFEKLYGYVDDSGEPFAGTKAVFNTSFTLDNSLDRVITTPERKFKVSYADYEWDWYKSGNRDAKDISELAKIWKNMMIPGTTEVVSNYGYFWKYNDQLERVINELKSNPESRRAVVVHYDLNELDNYKYDTPCNVVLNFFIKSNQLNLTVFARSIDLWMGFCNDQYQFSKLMEEVSEKLNTGVGKMHWYITNLHLYERHWNKIL